MLYVEYFYLIRKGIGKALGLPEKSSIAGLKKKKRKLLNGGGSGDHGIKSSKVIKIKDEEPTPMTASVPAAAAAAAASMAVATTPNEEMKPVLITTFPTTGVTNSTTADPPKPLLSTLSE